MASNLRTVRNPPLSISRKQFRDALLIVGTIGIIASIFAFVGTKWWIQGVRSKSWAVVDGEVQSYEVSGHGSKRSEHVRYTYRFGTNDFESARKSFGFKDGSQFEGAHPYPTFDLFTGSKVKVWVNPHAPAQAVLYPGVSFVTKIWTAASVFAFIFAATAGIAIIKSYRAKRVKT